MVAPAEAFGLDGKVAVVTGAASGPGIEFAEAGANVVCADVKTGPDRRPGGTGRPLRRLEGG